MSTSNPTPRSPFLTGDSYTTNASQTPLVPNRLSSSPIPAVRPSDDTDNFVNAGPRSPPPGTPSQQLLPNPEPQFALYPPRSEKSGDVSDTEQGSPRRPPLDLWVPVPLRAWFWVPLVCFLAASAIGLEIALAVTNKRQGWETGAAFTSASSFQHYLYTLPPVAITMILVALWAWTDIEIKKMQPYVDLVRGGSPAKRSLLLDYTRTNNFLVWSHAARNKHFVVALATLLVLVTLSFQPLAAAVLEVRDVWWKMPDLTVNNQALIGLNQDPKFNDLTSFLAASGYASASVSYRLDDPPFLHGEYTVGPFELPPRELVSNGTIIANTTAIKTQSQCRPADTLNMQQTPTGWSNSAQQGPCTISWEVDKSATNLFGATVPNCSTPGYPDIPSQFRPVVLWFFTYEPSAAASATFCTPAISLWDVTVNVDVATGLMTDVHPIKPLDSTSNYGDQSGTITGGTLNGRAYNGIDFAFVNGNNSGNPFVQARRAAIQLQLPSAVFQIAQNSPDGLLSVFQTGNFAVLATQVYTTYLKLIARQVYFTPASAPLDVEIRTVRKRLFLGDVAVHILAAAMFILALFGTVVHLIHRHERRELRLAHEPGTIASAVSIGAQTNMADLLDGRQKESEFERALRNKRFRIDPVSMKIVMEGDEGYEHAATPNPRRSVFGFVGPLSRRFSTAPGARQ